MGIEILIATEFQQCLRLPFGRHCNGTAEKRGLMAVSALTLEDQACKQWEE